MKHKTKRMSLVVAIVIAGWMLYSALSVFAIYPTTGHVDMARRIDSLGSGTQNLERYQQLSRTSESLWSANAAMVSSLTGLAIYVAAIGITYRYVRKHRLISNPAGRVVAIFVAAGTLGFLTSIATEVLRGIPTLPHYDAFSLVMTALISALVSLVGSFIVVLFFERMYDRKRSFLVE